MAESQRVDVLRCEAEGAASPSAGLTIVGAAAERLVVRQELGEARKAAIRSEEVEAKRVKSLRRLVALDCEPAPCGGSRRRTAAPTKGTRPLLAGWGNRAAAAAATEPQRAPVNREARGGLLSSQQAGRARREAVGAQHDGSAERSRLPLSAGRGEAAVSERDSQDSWSSSSASLPPPCEMGGGAMLGAPQGRKAFESPAAGRPSSLLRSAPGGACAKGTPALAAIVTAYHVLEEEFATRYMEYVTLDALVADRLAVFETLARLLDGAPHQGAREEEALIFRFVIEEQRLRDDKTYQETIGQLEECCAALLMIRRRLAGMRAHVAASPHLHAEHVGMAGAAPPHRMPHGSEGRARPACQ